MYIYFFKNIFLYWESNPCTCQASTVPVSYNPGCMHFCCQPKTQLQNYWSLWMNSYQGTWTGHAVLEWSGHHDWTAFCFHYWVKQPTSECESAHCFIYREMLASQKCHLDLMFCESWLKFSTILTWMPRLTAVCAVLWREGCREHVFSYMKARQLSEGRSLSTFF